MEGAGCWVGAGAVVPKVFGLNVGRKKFKNTPIYLVNNLNLSPKCVVLCMRKVFKKR
jgi:hypothetical protein